MQDVLVRLGLPSLADYGFALAGGYALQAYGLVERMSEDVDLFTNRWDPASFQDAVEALVEAYQRAGLEVTVVRRAETFARLRAVDPETGTEGSVDLAADFRGHEPTLLDVGPVLAEDDAVAAKVAAVFSRGYARDYLDLAGILATGRHSREALMALAAQVDGGFDHQLFVEALAGVDRFPDKEYARYGVSAEEIADVREALRSWSAELQSGLGRGADRRQAQEPHREPSPDDGPDIGT